MIIFLKGWNKELLDLGSSLSWIGQSNRKADPWRVCQELNRVGKHLRRSVQPKLRFWLKKSVVRELLLQADYYLFLAQDQGMLPSNECERIRRRVEIFRKRLVHSFRRS